MPSKKLYDRKVSTYVDKVHLFEVTENYVKGQARATGQSRAEIIREMCEYARLEKLTHGQFSAGTTKTFQSVTNKLFKTNIAEIHAEFQQMKVKFQELELNIRFDNEEVFKVMRAFFVENQLLSRLLHQLLKSNEIEIDIAEERQAMKASYQTNYNTRKDAFFAKYEQLLMEKLVNDARKSGVEDGVEDGAVSAESEDGGEDSDKDSEDSSEDSEAILAGSGSVN